ncbi:MAG: response regulator [Deltaproteobacteria bacterium]|nr:response regulator [Deltaproteobacteria bacterium]
MMPQIPPEALPLAVLDQFLEGCQLIGFDWRYIYVNDAVARQGRKSREEILGRTMMEAYPGIENTAMFDVLRRCMDERKPAQMENEFGFPDGSKEWFELRFEPVPQGVFILSLEITDRKRAEKAFLEREERYRQAQKMEAVGQLAGGVAHDFNNILSVIISYNGFVLDQLPPGSPLREDALEVKKAAEKAVALTRQLLAFSRRQVIEPRELVVNDAIRNINKMLGRLIGEHIVLELRLAPDAGTIRMDPGHLDQVLMNLAVNARDAMSGGGRLAIETARVTLDQEYAATRPGVTPGEHVVITVSDTGAGMPKEVQERAFEPFFTTKEKGKGTGLGLSMVYGAVKQNGGDVHLYSEPGKGTVFKLYFPRVKPSGEAQLPRDGTSMNGKGQRILMVEDDEAVRRATVRILENAGYQVVQAAGAEGALTLLQGGEPFDLVLTDVIMPGIGGVELGRRLAKSHPGLPVLYASGYTDDMLSQQGLLGPGANVVSKPFEKETLLEKIAQALSGRGEGK